MVNEMRKGLISFILLGLISVHRTKTSCLAVYSMMLYRKSSKNVTQIFVTVPASSCNCCVL